MRAFRKNTAVADLIQRDPTVGLPLFQTEDKCVSKKDQALLNAPRAIEHAEGTRRLARQTVTFDPGALAQKQLVVYDELKKYPNATNGEIAAALGWSVHRVVGRMFEIRELGFVVPGERRTCKQTGFICQSWVAQFHP